MNERIKLLMEDEAFVAKMEATQDDADLQKLFEDHGIDAADLQMVDDGEVELTEEQLEGVAGGGDVSEIFKWFTKNYWALVRAGSHGWVIIKTYWDIKVHGKPKTYSWKRINQALDYIEKKTGISY